MGKRRWPSRKVCVSWQEGTRESRAIRVTPGIIKAAKHTQQALLTCPMIATPMRSHHRLWGVIFSCLMPLPGLHFTAVA